MQALLRTAAIAALLVVAVGSAGAAPRRGGAKAQAAAAPTYTWREVEPDNLLVVDTNKGRILAELVPALAPEHVERIRTLARQHFYDGQVFFRVIDGFMDQTGDPKNTGEGGSTLPNLKGQFSFRRDAVSYGRFAAADPASDTAELGFVGPMPVSGQPSDLQAMTADGKVTANGLFCTGVLGMARATDPDSANSQFFFMRGTYASLDHNYTPFGRVLVGQDVVTAVKLGEPPVDPDRMITVRLASDLPAAVRPRVRVVDTSSAGFQAYVAAEKAKRGGDLSSCDLVLPAQVVAAGR